MAKVRKTKLNKKLLFLTALAAPLQVGGQAVIEGVMMRSPKAMAVAVRRPDGSVALKERPWHSVAESLPLLKKPFLRGSIVLFEALLNGIQALNFSAQEAVEGDDDEGDTLSQWAIFSTIAVSFLFGIALFVILPHLASSYLLEIMKSSAGLDSLSFHLLDGLIKMTLFATYVMAIGCLKDIKRVFQYHGAEHKSIYAYEAKENLSVENARKHSTLHPRCGTSFIMVVLLVSIALFALIIPQIPLPAVVWLKTPLVILFKIMLMIPVAGISYEIIRWAGKKKSKWFSVLLAPGLLMQRITTRVPTDDQIEIALIALKRALSLETEYQKEHSQA